MKKLIMVAVMLAMVAAMGVVPAVAAVRHGNGGFNDFNRNAFFNRFDPNAFFNRVNPHNGFDPNNFDANNGGGGISQGLANRSTTGSVTNDFTATSTGDNSNQCVTPLQFGNTGSQQNTQGVVQYASNSGGFFGGGGIDEQDPSFVFAPTLNGGCTQQVQQSSAASSQYAQ